MKPEEEVYDLVRQGADLANSGRYEEALKVYDKLLAEVPKLGDVWRARPQALFGLGRTQDAIVAHKQAIEVEPENAGEWELVDLGNLLFSVGKLGEAIAYYDRALRMSPESSWAWRNKGLAL